jgi:superfamily II DNA or RNA helicase
MHPDGLETPTPTQVSSSNPELLTLNFGLVKSWAKPGSWRRGYGYFQTKQATDFTLTDTGVTAKVKGNYQDHYTVNLHFQPQTVQADCSCPLSEEWCKHAVSVALCAIDQHLWEAFWKLPPNVPAPPENPAGNYRIGVQAKAPRFICLRFTERTTQKVVSQLEPVLRAAVALGADTFNETERRELALMQLALKEGQGAKDGWFSIKDVEAVLKLLPQHPDLITANGDPLQVSAETLTLKMGLNVSMAGNVLISLFWESSSDSFPLEDVAVFSKEVPWGLRKHTLYPLSIKLRDVPGHLTRSSFTDIRDADGGRFMYEELPRLRKILPIDQAEIIDQLHLDRKPPVKVLTVEKTEPQGVRASLDFSYDGVQVAYTRTPPDTPYVMVIRKAEEVLYWVKRDVKAEKAAYQQLIDGKLEPMQTNFLSAEGDDAIDVVNHLLPSLGEDWQVQTEGDFSDLKAAEDPLKIVADLRFQGEPERPGDTFFMKIFARVGTHTLDLDTVQAALMQGKKYFWLDPVGYVEVPLAAVLQFGKTLGDFDADPLEGDVYAVNTYKAGLLAELQEQGVQFDLSPVFETFWQQITAFQQLESVPVPEAVKAELRPYQRHGFNWLWFLYQYGMNGILADDMGLGKTLQTLVLLQKAQEAEGSQPSLIVCPTSVVYNWLNEARRFVPQLKTLNLTGPNRHGLYKQIKDADIVLTSYSILRRDISALKSYPFRAVILDESQNIKNVESQTAAASKQIQSQHRLALSGTPIENRLSELWSVFDFLMPGFLGDLEQFKYRYSLPIEEKGNRDAERRLKKQIFPFILRRMKRDVAKDLPPKIENVRTCELTDEQQALYLNILQEARDSVFAKVQDSASIGKNSAAIFAALMKLRQVSCHPALVGHPEVDSGKFEALQEMLEEITSEGHRVLVFSQFVEMLSTIRRWLEKKGLPFEILTGDTPAAERQTMVDRFNRDERIPIFLISLKAGGTGLNLTGADYVIHYDPWWNPAAEDQATDRAHRIGQTKNVFVYRLIAKGTVEEKIMKIKERKRDLVDSIISADRTMGKLLTFDDLKDILTPDF